MRLVQFKFGIGSCPIIVKTPIVKKELAKPCSFDSLQELFGNDLVCINIGAVQRGYNTAMNGKALHEFVCRWME